MAAVPDPTVLPVRAFVGGADWKAVVNGVDFANFPPMVSAYNSTGVSIGSGGSIATLIPLDRTDFDLDALNNQVGHDPSHPSRLYANYPDLWVVDGWIRFESNSSGFRQIDVRKNAGGDPTHGTLIDTIPWPAVNGAVTRAVFPPTRVWCVAGDYFELFGYHNAGVSLTTAGGKTASLTICRVGGQ